MSTLTEIEAAASRLTPLEQAELVSRMIEKLRRAAVLAGPGDIPPEQIREWLEDDARQGEEIRAMFGR